MIRRTETTTYYTLAELSAAAERGEASSGAAEEARDWVREGQADHDWWDHTYERWGTLLESVGFIDPQIRFSGFGSQGDGASFASSIDIEAAIRFLAAPPGASQSWGGETVAELQAVVAREAGGVESDPRFARLLWIAGRSDSVVRSTGGRYCHERSCTADIGFGLTETDSGLKDRSGHVIWAPRHHRLGVLVERFAESVEALRLALCLAIHRDLEEEYDYLTGDESCAETAEANGWFFDDRGRFAPGIDAASRDTAAELAAREAMC